MLNYVKGICFLIVFLYIICILGKSILKEKSYFFYDVIVGYTAYCTIQFVLTILGTVILKSHQIYFILMSVFLCILLANAIKHTDWKNIWEHLYQHIKVHGIVYFIVGCLLMMSFMNIEYLWMGNHLDDGYYIMKMANAFAYPTGNISYPSGLPEQTIFLRLLNTYELDYAYYVRVLGMSANVFAKFCMCVFNYLFYISCMMAIYCLLSKKEKEEICWKDHCILFLILLFGWGQYYLGRLHIIEQQDAWHFSNAAFYGSAFVRCTAIFLVLFTHLFFEKIQHKIIFFIMISVMLVSKASQAVPALAVACIAYILVYGLSLLKEHMTSKSLPYICIVLFVCVYLLACKFVGVDQALNETVKGQMQLLMHSLPYLICLLLLALCLLIGQENIKQCILYIVLIHVLTFVPIINKAMLLTSQYHFIVGRTVTTISYTTILLTCIVVYMTCHNEKQKFVVAVISTLIGLGSVAGYVYRIQCIYGLRSVASILVHNSELISQSTVELSEYLDSMSSQEDRKSVLAPLWVSQNNVGHSSGIYLNMHAPYIYNLSALDRYPVEVQEEGIKGFNAEDKAVFEGFNATPTSPEARHAISKLLKDYPIDILVVTSTEAASYLENQCHYTLMHQIAGNQSHYFILTLQG